MKILILLFMMSFIGCGSKRDPQVELIQDMMQSPAVKPQDYDENKSGSLAMRLPPEGTVPRQQSIPYRYYEIKTSEEAEQKITTPQFDESDFEMLQRGQKMYYIYCGACHGMTGRGDGLVATKTVLTPPSLVNDKIKGWQDGGIYHLITMGRGLMGSFAAQIPNKKDRWALVHFIRRLQEYAEPEDSGPEDSGSSVEAKEVSP